MTLVGLPQSDVYMMGRGAAGSPPRGTLDVVRGDDGKPSLARTLEGAPELVRRGATDVQLTLLAFARTPERLPDFFAELGERWPAVAESS